MEAKLFLKLVNGEHDVELGPFEGAAFSNWALTVNGGPDVCARMNSSDGAWHITDGAALGDEHLTGQVFPIIWGQAKLV